MTVHAEKGLKSIHRGELHPWPLRVDHLLHKTMI